MTKRALIAAGGTGGHMFPAQALAETLLAQGWQVTLSTDARGARYADGFPAQVSRQIVTSATTARGGLAARLAVPFRILRGVVGAVANMRRDRPSVVVGFGGYPTIPALSAARIMGIPTAIHEQNGVMGRVNALFAPLVDKVLCGTWPMEFPAKINAVNTGNPVRQAVLDHAAAPYFAPDGEDGLLRLLVIGGSQGARVLSDTVPAAVAALPADIRVRLRVAHQTRDEDIDRVRSAYEAARIDAEIRPFFDDVAQRLDDCQLVISRAGASSVADISVIGRPAILIPYGAASGDHQSANARVLGDAGAALVLPEALLDVATLMRDILVILTDAPRATRMADAARILGRPDAAHRVATFVTELTQ